MSRDYRGGAGSLAASRRSAGRDFTPQNYELPDDIIPMECNKNATCTLTNPSPGNSERSSVLSELNDLNYRNNPDIGMKSSKIQAMKTKLDDLEPRINVVGDKMQRVADDMGKFRDLLTVRRKEIEELERTVNDRICRSEQKVQSYTRELNDYKVETASDQAALRQTVSTLASEVACLRTWVLENLRQINAKLDNKDRDHQSFKACTVDRIKGCERGLTHRGGDVQDLRSEVESRFAALKEALSAVPKTRPPQCEPCQAETNVTDTVITTISRGGDDYDGYRQRKSAGSRDVSPVYEKRVSDPRNPGGERNSQPRDSTDTGTASNFLVSEVVHSAEAALDQIKRDSARLGTG